VSSSEKGKTGSGWLSKKEARAGLQRIQKVIGIALVLSAAAGIYLLLTDNSLWLLALSHAVGLIIVVVVDIVLGGLCLLSVRRAYLPSLAGAFLGIVLQVGDIATAPQYNMTIPYFASYLFGLLAFDLLLFLQGFVLAAALFGRAYAQHLARVRSRRGKELGYSRRGFVKAIASLTGLVTAGVILGSIKLPPVTPQSAQTTQSQTGLPQGAIANINGLQADSPIYFEYPQGYPNMLMKKSDGSLLALSILCTHVCCTCSYDSASKLIYCPCHGSIFDTSGSVRQGPALTPLPSIQLRVDGAGNVFPTGILGSGPCVQAQ
jgi:Rieske Fe-S protein